MPVHLKMRILFLRKSLCALAVCKGAGHHILLENLVEVVGIAEAYRLGNLGHGHLGRAKQLHSGVDAHTVYVIYRCLAYRFLEHLGKVVGRDVYHRRKLLDIYLLSEMLVYIADNRSES